MKAIHFPQAPWLLSSNPTYFTIRVWVKTAAFSSITLYYSDPYNYAPETNKNLQWKVSKMELLITVYDYDVWTCDVAVPTHKLSYMFDVFSNDNAHLWFGNKGLFEDKAKAGCFRTGYYYGEDRLPSWTGKSVWYQIFPDRFAGAKYDESFLPTTENFWGGTLDGICAHIPYLKSLGITGLYLNPVFSSPSNHRYDTLDYTCVDDRLGTNETLITLANQLHQNNMKLMLDGVYNHASSKSYFFQDVIRNGSQSPYLNWFIIHDLDAVMKVPESNLIPERMKENPPYECFAFAANMPKWNTDNPEVQDYLIRSAEMWTRKLHLDAWRLDVPDEVSPTFLRSFRRRMRMINPEILIVGEIWTDPCPWTQTGLFDGTMDYPLYDAISRFLLNSTIDAYEFCNLIKKRQAIMTPAMLQNQMLFLGNHDLPRCLTIANGNIEKIKAAWLFICILDGEVSLYYGDEFAMTGGADPANRGVMNWGTKSDAFIMNNYIKQTIALRRKMLSSPITDVHIDALTTETVIISITRENNKYYLYLSNSVMDDVKHSKTGGTIVLRGKYFELRHKTI